MAEATVLKGKLVSPATKLVVALDEKEKLRDPAVQEEDRLAKKPARKQRKKLPIGSRMDPDRIALTASIIYKYQQAFLTSPTRRYIRDNQPDLSSTSTVDYRLDAMQVQGLVVLVPGHTGCGLTDKGKALARKYEAKQALAKQEEKDDEPAE